jgi:hypothetical protein
VLVLGTRVVGRLASDVVAALSLPESQKALGTGSSPKSWMAAGLYNTLLPHHGRQGVSIVTCPRPRPPTSNNRPGDKDALQCRTLRLSFCRMQAIKGRCHAYQRRRHLNMQAVVLHAFCRARVEAWHKVRYNTHFH